MLKTAQYGDVAVAREDYAAVFGSPSYYSGNRSAASPYPFVRLSKDEMSVAFEVLHRVDTVAHELPLGARTFAFDNRLFWSRCAKAALLKMRNARDLLSGVDASHDNGRKYAEDLTSQYTKAKAEFRQALMFRRNKQFLLSGPDADTPVWVKDIFIFCSFLLNIHESRCDNNFVGQMIDKIISPAYQEFIDCGSPYLYRSSEIDEGMQEYRKVKTIAAFVLERPLSLYGMSLRYSFERCFAAPECNYAAAKLGIQRIYDKVKGCQREAFKNDSH